MHLFRKGNNMQENIIIKNNKDFNKFLKAKVDVTIFTKNGKIQSKNIKNLSSFLKKQPLTI